MLLTLLVLDSGHVNSSASLYSITSLSVEIDLPSDPGEYVTIAIKSVCNVLKGLNVFVFLL